jgi:ubiquinone/menaquinone biosynthesis C-methylase UbiE
VLDLGCGEGATLYHLGEPEGACGVDLFEEKITFARERLKKCKFACASVYALPFEDQSFDHLLVRDLIHHLDEPERFMDECARVLSDGGRVDVLEPCRYNPMVFAHALSIRAERGELRSTMPVLTRFLSARFRVTRTEVFQGLPVHRVVFHPRFGRPEWGREGLVRRIVDVLETAADALMPRFAFAYLHLRAVKR